MRPPSACCRLFVAAAVRLPVWSRAFHRALPRHALPVPSSVESAASKWVQSLSNPNRSSAHSNLPLALALLRAAHRRERLHPSSAHSSNIVINPVSVALQLRDSPQCQQSLLSSMEQSVSGEQLQSWLTAVDHSHIAAQLTAANNQFAQWSFTPHSHTAATTATTSGVSASTAVESASASSASVVPRPTSSFKGFLAPRFALTKTVSPSWFIPTPTATQQADFHNSPASHAILPYRADDTAVTALERSIRVAARMLYRTGKLWYVEGTRHQMVDVPYLHTDYSLTLLCARWTDEPSIDDHPQVAYGNVKREKADIHTLLAQLSPQQLVHDMRYMTLLPGLLVMPAFDAHYHFQLGSDGGLLTDTSRLVVSGAGLQSGGLKTLSHRPGRPFPHFLLSAHRPFIFLIRHRPTNHVALIGLIEHVERDTTPYKYKDRKVQWLEDTLPIQQF